jgi:hypothetical protein
MPDFKGRSKIVESGASRRTQDGMAMAHGTLFSTEIDGTQFSARFHVSGRRVVVVSIYGERGATIGREPPLFVAKRLLGELVLRRGEEKRSVARAVAANGDGARHKVA